MKEVVRQFGVNQTHVAEVPEGLRYLVTIFGKEGEAVQGPIVTVCRAELKREPIVVMTRAKVHCRPCAKLSGIERV